jgi:hypothetical protein
VAARLKPGLQRVRREHERSAGGQDQREGGCRRARGLELALAVAELREIILELLSRPGHEKVRALVHRLLTGSRQSDGFAVDQ